MESKEKYEYWLDAAEYDLNTARAMFDSGRYVYVVFMCQQAIEKISKGIYTLFTDNEPPRTHNIWNIFKRLNEEVVPQETLGIDDFEITLKSYKDFFAELLSYYISGRYPSFKEKLSDVIDANRAQSVLKTTEEVFEWIESLSQYKE